MNRSLELIEYNIWANNQLVSQIKGLARKDVIRDVHGCFPSLLHAVLHLFKSDWIWLERWKGTDFKDAPGEWDALGIKDIEIAWRAVQAETMVLLRSRELTDGEKDIFISNGSSNTLDLKFSQTVNVVANHGAYYRGQVANMIETMGIQPARTQLFDYYLRKKPHDGKTKFFRHIENQ